VTNVLKFYESQAPRILRACPGGDRDVKLTTLPLMSMLKNVWSYISIAASIFRENFVNLPLYFIKREAQTGHCYPSALSKASSSPFGSVRLPVLLASGRQAAVMAGFL